MTFCLVIKLVPCLRIHAAHTLSLSACVPLSILQINKDQHFYVIQLEFPCKSIVTDMIIHFKNSNLRE